MANTLPADLTFSNPRLRAEFDDWPSGAARVKCEFWVESAKRGFRACRRTQDKRGQWCKPKATIYSGHAAIVDGSDGRTYVLQVAAPYGFVHVYDSAFMTGFDSVFSDQPRHAELLEIIGQAYGPHV